MFLHDHENVFHELLWVFFPNCDLNVHLYGRLNVLTFDENDDLCHHVHDDQNLSHDRIGDHVPKSCDHDKNSVHDRFAQLRRAFQFSLLFHGVPQHKLNLLLCLTLRQDYRC